MMPRRKNKKTPLMACDEGSVAKGENKYATSNTQSNPSGNSYQPHRNGKRKNKHRLRSYYQSERTGLQSQFDQSESNSCQASTSQQPVEENQGKSSDIPGFYYDAEKKRYFKILPGQISGGTGVVTKEVIKQKESERKRENDIKQMSSCRKLPSPRTKVLSAKQSTCYLQSLQQCGHVNSHSFRTKIYDIYRSHLQPIAKSKIFDKPAGNYERLEHMHRMYQSQSQPNHLVSLWSLRDLLVQRIQTVAVDSIIRDEKSTKLNISTTGAMIPKAFSKITDMCSAPVNSSNGDVNEYILYTTRCLIGNNPSMAMIRNLYCSNASDFRYTEFNLGNMVPWCCSWNSNLLRFSIGTEKHALVLDVETRRLWELFTAKDDVLTQVFSNDSRILYSGTRTKGMLFAHDLRSNSTGSTFSLGHGSGISSVRLSADDIYMYAAAFNSKIRRWDLRMRRVVVEYVGHQNKYSVLPIHINEDQNLLYAVGQDCYTRLWELTTGSLLGSIPPPYPAAMDSIPSVVYAANMTHIGSRPGLYMGIKDELHFYSL